MSEDRPYVERNTHERERLRGLVARLTDDDLRRLVTDRWTVADMLGHLAFWDARALSLAEKLEAGVPFVPADHEPEDVDDLLGGRAKALGEHRRIRVHAQSVLLFARESNPGC